MSQKAAMIQSSLAVIPQEPTAFDAIHKMSNMFVPESYLVPDIE